MDTAALMTIFDESLEEALERGVDMPTAQKEAKTAAAMMLAATDGLEDSAAYAKIEEIVAANAGG